jgi:hypothetical protein
MSSFLFIFFNSEFLFSFNNFSPWVNICFISMKNFTSNYFFSFSPHIRNLVVFYLLYVQFI